MATAGEFGLKSPGEMSREKWQKTFHASIHALLLHTLFIP